MTEYNTATLPSYSARAKGAMFFAIFGTAWLALWNQRAMQGNWLGYLLIAACGLALLVLAMLRQRQYQAFAPGDNPASRKLARVFHLINAAQWVIILVAGNVLANLGYADWVVPVAMLVIGLHFLPLSRLFNAPGHFWLGLLMSLFAIAYPFLLSGGPADPYGCMGAGLLLWGYAWLKLLAIPTVISTTTSHKLNAF